MIVRGVVDERTDSKQQRIAQSIKQHQYFI
jgi:hypothetical protein